MSDPAGVLLVGDGPVCDAIAERLRVDGAPVVRSTALDGAITAPQLAALVVVAPPPHLGTPFLDVDDAQLTVGLDRFLDLFGLLAEALPRLGDGGAVVLVESRGHLGGWDGAHEMAFTGAAAGLMRSAALETMARGVRANVVALELPDATGATAPDPAHVADLVAFLLSPAGAVVTGELLLANGGRSLQMQEARDRRPARGPTTPPPEEGARE